MSPSAGPVSERARTATGTLRRLYWRAFDDNLTGLAAMVAYNLLLSVFPLALVALFIGSQVIQSSELQASVFEDLRQLFPSAAESTLINLLDSIRTSTTGIGIVALVVSIWIGGSFWGSLDTAFCQIYHVGCRSWLRQKAFGLLMLGVSLLFILATVALPTLQSIVIQGADDLPFGLADVQSLIYLATLVGSVLILFVLLAIVYRTVPHTRVPWRAVWPGAAGATIAISIIDYAFPAYLSNISALAGLGTTLIFIVIVLIWFFALAIVVLAGAEINALRLAQIEERARAAADLDAGQPRDEAEETPVTEDTAPGPRPAEETTIAEDATPAAGTSEETTIAEDRDGRGQGADTARLGHQHSAGARRSTRPRR